MMDLKADLATFFNPAEFGSNAVVALPFGGLQITGNVSKYALQRMERPGSNGNSGFGAFLAGTAEFNMHGTQFMTAWLPQYENLTECPLTIQDGDYAGEWVIRFIERDGDVARMILNLP